MPYVLPDKPAAMTAREEMRLGVQGGLRKHWEGWGKCLGGAKGPDPSQVSLGTCHSPQSFCFNTTLRIWGLLAGGKLREVNSIGLLSTVH